MNHPEMNGPAMNKNRLLASLVRGVLEEWNRLGISYCVLRNYDFLFDASRESGTDLDLVVERKSIQLALQTLHQQGWIPYPDQFSKTHSGFRIYVPSIHQKFGFDIQVGGIHWNDMCYLPEELLLTHKVKKDFLYVPSAEDALIMYLGHSLLGKRFFKEKYKEKIRELSRQRLDWHYLEERLLPVFGGKSTQRIVSSLKVHNYSFLQHKGWGYALWFILRSPRRWFTMVGLSLRWLRWKRFFHSYPLIAFIGPDGSGKSSNAQKLYELLSQVRKTSLVYTGRGKGNILPIKSLAGMYKKKEEKHGLKP